MRDHELAETELDNWISEASGCGLKAIEDLSEKIGRHRENILNSVRLQANSAKSESANTTIKALIKVARGFRNIDNLIAFIYLKCSDLVIPLNNRYQPSAEKSAEKRNRNNELRHRLTSYCSTLVAKPPTQSAEEPKIFTIFHLQIV